MRLSCCRCKNPFTCVSPCCTVAKNVMILVLSVCPLWESHVTITNDALDLTIQGVPPLPDQNPAPRTWTPQPWPLCIGPSALVPLVVTPGGQDLFKPGKLPPRYWYVVGKWMVHILLEFFLVTVRNSSCRKVSLGFHKRLSFCPQGRRCTPPWPDISPWADTPP